MSLYALNLANSLATIYSLAVDVRFRHSDTIQPNETLARAKASKKVDNRNRMRILRGITVTITEPERKSMLQKRRASPASRASFCYSALKAVPVDVDVRIGGANFLKDILPSGANWPGRYI